MSVEVRLPSLLRAHAGGQATVTASGDNLRQVFDDLNRQYPGLDGQLVSEDGSLHKFLNVYVNDDDVRFLDKLDTPVRAGDSVTILPAVAGG